MFVLGVLGSCGTEPDARATASANAETPQMPATGNADGSLTLRLEGGASVSCVAEFSARTLRERAFAFDGTVVEARVEQDSKAPGPELDMRQVVFVVHEWFIGGDQDVVEVWVPAEVFAGDRLLLSGEPRWGGEPFDDAIAWTGCGFTTPHTVTAAGQWRAATSD